MRSTQLDPEKLVWKYGRRNVEAEKKIVAAFVLEGQMGESKRLAKSIRSGIAPDSFIDKDLSKVYEAAIAIHESGDTIDEVSLVEEIGRNELRGDTAMYLSELTDKFDALNVFDRNLEIMLGCWSSRELALRGLRIAKRLFEEKEYTEAIASSSADLSDLQAGLLAEKGVSLKEVVANVRDNLRREHKGERQEGAFFIRTGIERFDKIAGCFSSTSDLVNIIAARPSVGKTSLVTQIIQQGLVDFKEGVFIDFQLENRRDNHVRQMAARYAKVNLRKVDVATQEQMDRMYAYLDRVEEVAEERLFVFDGNMTIEEIVSKIRYIHKSNGRVNAVAIDYFQLIRSRDTKERNHVLVMENISRTLKLLAKEVGCPFFVLAQLGRDSEKDDRRPRLSDLKWTGALEQDADRVILIHDTGEVIDEERKIQLRELIQAKNKYGPKGVVPVGFEAPFTEFIDVEESE